MSSTVDAQVPLMSNAGVGIGEAAHIVGMAPSAIRYYESEGLIAAPPRHDGRRRYGPEALRALAFIAIGRRLGLSVAAIRAALHSVPGRWAEVIDAQVKALDEQIALAKRARDVLLSSRDCPAAVPVRDCPYLRGALDALIAGEPLPDPLSGH
jgi:MerR family transcriptional regulator, redox-sensitive transcriptional activator SoxR